MLSGAELGGAGREEGAVAHTLGVQETCNPQVPLCYRESLVQVLQVGLTIHLVHVDEHGPGGKGAGGAGRQGHGSSEAPWEGQQTERPSADPRDTEPQPTLALRSNPHMALSPAHTGGPCAGPAPRCRPRPQELLGPAGCWGPGWGAGAQGGVLVWAPCSYPVHQALGSWVEAEVPPRTDPTQASSGASVWGQCSWL